MIRKLAVAAVLSGSLAFSFAQVNGTWTGGGPGINWSTGNNWYGGTPPTSLDRVYFEDVFSGRWTNQIGAVNNIVDVNTAVATLYYSAFSKSTNNHFYTTQIPLGVTLTVGGYGAVIPTMAVGDIPGENSWVSAGYTNYTQITGPGTLFVNDLAGTISVGGSVNGTLSGPWGGTVLDLTNLFTFNANVAKFYLAVSTDNPFQNAPQGYLFLARTNTITTTADGGAAPGILLGSAFSFAPPGGPYLVLGAVNNFNSDAFVLGGESSSTNYLTFTNFTVGPVINGQPTSRFLGNTGNFRLRGSAGGISRAAYFSIGDVGARVGTMQGTTVNGFSAQGIADLRNGTVDVLADKLLIGHGCLDAAGPANGSTASGTLIYESGTIDANNAYLAYKPGTNGITAIGNLTLQSNAVMNVNNNFYMAYVPDQPASYGTLVQALATNTIRDNAVLNIGGNLQHNDGAFLQTNGSSTLILAGGTINMLNNGNVSLWNLQGFGTITNAFSIAISNSFSPGTPGSLQSIGTLNLNGNVAFQGPFPINFDLGTVTNKGAPFNDYVNIQGNVSFNSNQITLKFASAPQLGTYRLIDYTGTKSGSLTFTNNTRSPITLDQSTSGRIQLLIPSWTPGTLTWNGLTNLFWSDSTVTNWNALTNQQFLSFDNVRFDDSVGASAFTNICFPVGFLYPSSIYITNSGTFNLTNRFNTAGLDGAIRGSTGITKDGAGLCNWSVGTWTNTFTGDVRINQGVFRLLDTTSLNPVTKLFLGYGNIYVTNGATLDLTNFPTLGTGNPLYISGTGKAGYTSGGSAGDGVITGGGSQTAKWLKVRLANDATISTWNGFVAFGGNSGLGVTTDTATAPAGLVPMGQGELSLNGYTLTVQGTNNKSLQLEDVVASTAGNILVKGTILNLRRTSITGPGTMTFTNKSFLSFLPPTAGFAFSGWQSTIGKNIVATNWAVQGQSNNIYVGPGTNLFTGTISVAEDLNFVDPHFRGMLVSNDSVMEFDGPISGDTSLYKMGKGPVILNAANTYTSNTFVNGGTMILGPSGSVAALGMTLNPNPALPTTTLDVSAASYALGSGQWLNLNGTLPGDVRVNGNVTVNSGATLFGIGTINGSLIVGPGSEIAPGGTNNQGQFIVNGDLAMHGAHLTWDMTPSFASGDGIVVNGNLDISTAAGNTNVWTIDSIGGFSPDGTNTLITYTGTLTTNAAGALTGLALYNPSIRFVQTLIDPNLTPGKIQVVLTAPPGNLTWTGTDATHPSWWDIKTTTNWLNAGTNDIFASADYVTFNASGVVKTIDLGAAGPSLKPLTPGSMVVQGASYTFQGTNGLITSSLMVSNGATLIVSNRQDNQIVGFGTFVTAGSTLTFSQATNATLYSDLYGGGVFNKSGSTNRLKVIGDASGWFGSINVTAGQLAAGQSNAISGPVAVTAGGTLDLGGQAIPGAVITAVGAGVDGMGAINNRLNVSTNLIGLQSNVVNSLTLVGNTTIGAISNAWGITNLTGGGFNLVKTNANDVWIMTGTDTGLGDVTVGQGRLIFAAAGTGLGATNKTITVYSGATLGFAATNITSTALIFDAQRPSAYNPTFKNLVFSNANLQMLGLVGSFNSTSRFSGPITFTNDLNLILDNNTLSTLDGNIAGPPAGATPIFGSLIVSGSGSTSLNLFGTNSYASNTWVKSGWINISNQINIPTNTALILSNSVAPSLPIQLTLLGGGEFTNRTLRISSSNAAVTVQGDARWWGNMYLHGNLGVNLNSSTNGGLDLAFTNIDTTSGVGGPFRIGANSTRIRGSLRLKVAPFTATPSGTMEIGYNGPSTVEFDNTNNWYYLTFDGGRINWGAPNILPPGAPILMKGGCLMDLHGFDQSVTTITENGPAFSSMNAIFNDSPASDSTLTIVAGNYAFTNSVTNCTTVMLSDTTNTTTPKKLNFTVTSGVTELLNTNTYTGPTLVTGGKLLLGNYTTNSTVFSGTLSGSSSVTVSGTGIFGGNGFVGCPVTVNSGGALLPGECLEFKSSVAVLPPPVLPPAVLTRCGQLTFGNTNLTLGAGGYVLFNADNTTNQLTGAVTNASIAGLFSVTYGGTLIVSNVSSVPFTNNQVLKLFDAGSYNGSFSSVLVWGALNGSAVDTSGLATNGTIRILTAVSTTPFKIGLSRPNKNTLSLSWPADHLGWRLQVMTNSLGTGMLTNSYVVLTNITGVSTNITTNVVQLANWVDCANGQNITSTNISIGTTNVIFRLKYP